MMEEDDDDVPMGTPISTNRGRPFIWSERMDKHFPHKQLVLLLLVVVFLLLIVGLDDLRW